jgi:hypothetical protein
MLRTFARDEEHEGRTSDWRVVDRIRGTMTTCRRGKHRRGCRVAKRLDESESGWRKMEKNDRRRRF